MLCFSVDWAGQYENNAADASECFRVPPRFKVEALPLGAGDAGVHDEVTVNLRVLD
jgi:hypothetical protein